MIPDRSSVGRSVPLAAVVISSSDGSAIPAGYVGLWSDGTSLFKRSAGGSDSVVGGVGTMPVFVAVTKTASALPACTYDNGPDNNGVGATLLANANGALGAISGVTLVAGANTPILVDSQASPAQNGLYLPTAIGGNSAKWKLTRLPGFDRSAEIVDGALVAIQQGTYAGRVYVQTATVTTIGTDSISFSQQANVMLLDVVQRVTAAHTFADATLKQENAGGTAAHTFASNATSARTVTLPDATFTVPQDALVAHLAGGETFTGLKNFAQGTLKVDNNSTTNAHLLASSATQARTATLPDKSGTVAFTDDVAAAAPTVMFGFAAAAISNNTYYLVGAGQNAGLSATPVGACFQSGTKMQVDVFLKTAPGNGEDTVFSAMRSTDGGTTWTSLGVGGTISGTSKETHSGEFAVATTAGDLIAIRAVASAGASTAGVTAVFRAY